MAEPVGNKAFEAAISEIDRQIEELRQARETLVRLSGKPAPTASPSPSPATAVVEGDPLLAVREQEFSGMSSAKAARAFLQKIGRHEKTQVIIAALKKGGVEVRGKNPISTIYTTLSRRPGFVSLGKNYWDLAERRPDLAQEKKQKQLRGSKHNKRKKPGPKPGSKRVVRLAPEAATA